jgi:predicted component of type VI protein secretion system
MVSAGVTRIGRDPAADWVIADPECEISRTHLEILCDGGALSVRALGANGVFAGAPNGRLPDGEPYPLMPGEAITFGRYRMVVEDAPFAGHAAGRPEATMIFAAPFGETVAVPRDWADAEPMPAPAAVPEASLLEAFCEGAGLDLSSLSGEDPGQIMRCAGAIYRQMLLGLSDLMRERSATRSDLNMDRTTIGARDNNPLKWAPTRKLATGLLLHGEAGFLSGPDAIRGSFEDIKKHMLGTLAGYAAGVEALLGALSPERIEGATEGQSHFLKNRQAQNWAQFERVHEDLLRQVLARESGTLDQAFVEAYERKVDGLAIARAEDSVEDDPATRAIAARA